jgi:ATP-binding cassette subfamily C protein
MGVAPGAKERADALVGRLLTSKKHRKRWEVHSVPGAAAQQIALARLILVDPAIVVLDEATADVGSAGVQELDAAAELALAGGTAVVVAHRLSQAAVADRIVVLDNGRIVETGSHSELLGSVGFTYTDWTSCRYDLW